MKIYNRGLWGTTFLALCSDSFLQLSILRESMFKEATSDQLQVFPTSFITKTLRNLRSLQVLPNMHVVQDVRLCRANSSRHCARTLPHT